MNYVLMCACFELQCSEGIHTSIIMRTADIPVTITRIIIQIPITTNFKTIISITTEKRKAVHTKINRELTYNIFKVRRRPLATPSEGSITGRTADTPVTITRIKIQIPIATN